jgi:cytidyltransferase-like protein
MPTVKTVYSYFVMDILHRGHLRMLTFAKSVAGAHGKLIVRILTDQVVMERKTPPILSYVHRREIAQSLKYIDEVVPQETYSPLPNVEELRPDVLMESTSHRQADIAEARLRPEWIASKTADKAALDSSELADTIREVFLRVTMSTSNGHKYDGRKHYFFLQTKASLPLPRSYTIVEGCFLHVVQSDQES